eukprot:gene33340-40330_t
MTDSFLFQQLLNLLTSAYPSFDEIKRLLEENRDLVRQRRSSDGATPLHVACFNSTILLMPDLIKYLVFAYPEALLAANSFRQTPVHKALSVATTIHLESVEFLLKSVVDAPLAITKDGQNFLHNSLSQSRESSEEIVSMLVNLFPLLVELPDKYGQYPIHLAARKKKTSLNIIQSLVEDIPHSLLWKDSMGPSPDLEVVLYMCEKCPKALFEVDNASCTPYMRYIQREGFDKEIEQMLIQIIEVQRSKENGLNLRIAIPIPTASNNRRRSTQSLIRKTFRSPAGKRSSPRSLISGK